MLFNNILYEVQDGVAHLTLNRPEVANGFNVAMCEELLQALEQAACDESVFLVMLSAKGRVFSVGGDLVEMKRAVDADDIESLVAIAELVNTISFAIKKLAKPVIMLADGAVAGAAANIAVACDFVIASEKTKFIQAFVGVGLAPDAGGLYLLSRAIGTVRATQLAMTGEALKAQEAKEYGIVYKVCPCEELDKVSQQLIKKLKRSSINSFKAIKEMIWQSSFADWQAYATTELSLQKALAFTEDFKEGVRAYSDKRRPQFQGK
ncbi:enoyl-CoA hydratase [Streptococcus sp. zg-JUN1979]|uniref:trans-2-decenoyl-ACP isomerase n=1 Tax=Streptococcus sp. zg-JUN1979 TaxID=3391450 RepID=UPI0039A65C74